MKTYNPHPKQEVFHRSIPEMLLYGGAREKMKINPMISDMFFDWLKKTHPNIQLHPSQQIVVLGLNPNVSVLVGYGTGKSFLFNLIEEFLRNEDI